MTKSQKCVTISQQSVTIAPESVVLESVDVGGGGGGGGGQPSVTCSRRAVAAESSQGGTGPVVHQPRSSEAQWEWRVPDFWLLPCEPVTAVRDTPVLAMPCSAHGEVRWAGRLHPGGDDDGVGDDYRRVTLTLVLREAPTALLLVRAVRVALVDARGEEACGAAQRQLRLTFRHGDGIRFDIVTRRELRKRHEQLVPENTLTIRCAVAVENVLADVSGYSPLADCLGKLFTDQRDGDVLIQCKGGAEFRAHRSVICSRSLVFHRKFRMHAGRKRIIVDGVGADAVWEMLYYVYTDRAPRLAQMVPELREAARLYDLPGLVHLCDTHVRERDGDAEGGPACRRPGRCAVCVRERRVASVSDLAGDHVYPVPAHLSHGDTHLVYAIYCVRCARYVYVGAGGGWRRPVRAVVAADIADIKAGRRQLGIHFSYAGHGGYDDCEVTLVEKIPASGHGRCWFAKDRVTERDRRLRKTFWAVKLQTRVIDGGANEILHYK